MRIGINALFLIPTMVGGSETYLIETTRQIISTSDRHTLVFFTNMENDSFLRDTFADHTNVEFHGLAVRAQSRVCRILAEQFRLPRAAHAANLDVLWSPGYTAPLFLNIPQAVSVLDMQYKEFPEDLSPIARLVTDILVPAAVKRCDSVIAISEFTKSEILRYIDVREDKIHVTPLAACTDHDTPAPTTDTTELISAVSPFFLCVANTYPHKHVHTLVRAFDTVADSTDHHLVLVGQPGKGEELTRNAISKCRHRDRVTRLSYQSRAALIALYRAADVFVFPSMYEGFGIPILEAMVAGTRVVTTRAGAIPEVAGKHATYLDSMDPDDIARTLLTTVKEHGKERETKVENARLYALQTFSWQRTAHSTVECLAKMVKSNGQ